MLVRFAFSSRISFTGEGEDTAACKTEFGCLAGASTITVSETEQREEDEADEGTVGVVGGVMGAAQMDPQLLFFVPATAGWPVVEEDNAANETEFCCLQGVIFAALDSGEVEVEGGTRERGRMGVRMRMVKGERRRVRGAVEK